MSTVHFLGIIREISKNFPLLFHPLLLGVIYSNQIEFTKKDCMQEKSEFDYFKITNSREIFFFLEKQTQSMLNAQSI